MIFICDSKKGYLRWYTAMSDVLCGCAAWSSNRWLRKNSRTRLKKKKKTLTPERGSKRPKRRTILHKRSNSCRRYTADSIYEAVSERALLREVVKHISSWKQNDELKKGRQVIMKLSALSNRQRIVAHLSESQCNYRISSFCTTECHQNVLLKVTSYPDLPNDNNIFVMKKYDKRHSDSSFFHA